NAAFSSPARQCGNRWARIAAAAETWGVDMEVPLSVVYQPSDGSPVPSARAATMSTPGAAMSGLSPMSQWRGPRLENHAIPSCLSVAATARAESAAAGAVTVRGRPLLPAATTNRAPVLAVSWSTARLSGSVPSLGPAPRLIDTMSASIVTAAHSMPAMIDEYGQPAAPHTRPLTSVAPGATPRYRP